MRLKKGQSVGILSKKTILRGIFLTISAAALGAVSVDFASAADPDFPFSQFTPNTTPEERELAEKQMKDYARLYSGTPLADATIDGLVQAELWTLDDGGKTPPTAAGYPASYLSLIPTFNEKGDVPDFFTPVSLESDPAPQFSEEEEEEYLTDSIENRRDIEGIPSMSMVLRRFGDHLLEKYDENHNGKLEEAEWTKIPGSPQAIDMNGDLIIEDHEILFYLARYADGRTIARPIPRPKKKKTKTVIKSDAPIMIHPLSKPIKVLTPEEAEEAEKQDSAEQNARVTAKIEKMMNASEKEAGTEENPELFDILNQTQSLRKQEYSLSEADLQGLPAWFVLRDSNGDGQLSLREFTPYLSLEATAFFGRLDANKDGLVTPEELKNYQPGQAPAQ